MYKTALISAVLSLLVISVHCDTLESGRILPEFNRVEISGNISVFMEKAGINSASLTAKSSSAEDLSIYFSGRTMIIRSRSGFLPSGRIELNITSAEDLREIRVSSGGRVKSYRNIFSDSGEISALSGSLVDVYADTDVMTVSAGRNSRITLKGKTGTLEARASDGGSVDAEGFISQKVFASARTGGSLRVYAEEYLDAGSARGSVIYYRGDPEKIYFSEALGGEYMNLDDEKKD